jgi:glycerol kinase
VEHKPDNLLSTVQTCIESVMRAVNSGDVTVPSASAAAGGGGGDSKSAPVEVAAVGITNQRETTVVWDKTTGKPLHNALGTDGIKPEKLFETCRIMRCDVM